MESALQPPNFDKLTLPVLATFGTVAVICVLLFTVNKAGVAPNLTEVVTVRLVHVITKLLPIAVEALPKLVKVGGEFTVIVPAAFTVPQPPVNGIV